MNPKAEVLHRISHRVRIRIGEKARDHAYFKELRERLEALDPVQSVRVNPVAATVLIHYLCKFEELSGLVAGFLEVVEGRGMKPWEKRFVKRVESLDQKVKRATGREFDLMGVVGLGFLGLAAFQIFRRQYLPAATSLLSEALYLFVRGGSKG